MRSARFAVTSTLAAITLAASIAGPFGAGAALFSPATGPAVSLDAPAPVAAPAWPVSHGLLIGEVVTGAASASDEYVEIVNAGTEALDLAGLELAYVTSSGATVTRKATWAAARLLASGQRLLVANASGVFASSADATYSGGLAATGGALVLRPIGGLPIDAVAWGDATNGFVESSAAPAPPAGASIERLPGGPAGNWVDSNDNSADWVVQAFPAPEGLTASPMPVASPTVEPSPSVVPTPEPSPTTSPLPSPSPSIVPTPEPSIEPSPSTSSQPSADPSSTASPQPSIGPTPPPSAEPSPRPSPSPTATAEPSLLPTPGPSVLPTPEPSIVPTSSPSSSPTSTPVVSASPEPTSLVTSIGDARALGAGALVTIAGILTTDLGGLEAGRTAFVQDATGGIALWLDDASSTAWPAGSSIRATGTLDTRYGQRILRVATTDAVLLGAGLLPVPRAVTTGEAATEASEGWRLAASGTVVESCEALSDGTSTVIDDGSGPLRIVVTPAALASRTLSRGAFVHVRGPLGQRDSTGAGTAGYRLYVVLSEDLEIDAPTPSPTPEATPIGSGEPGPDPTASTPPEEQDEVAIEDARATAIGAEVRVAGTVVAEAPRLGSTQLIAIQDATAGIVVHLVNGGPTPVRGDWIHVTGTLAAPYGQLELRPAPGGLSIDGCASLPTALVVTAMDVGEGTEGRLVTMVGRRDGGVRREGDGGLSLNIRDAAGGSIRIMADASSRLSVAAFPAGRNLTITGIVGQRATATGRLDGYRIWVRDASDVIRAGADAATPAPSAARSPAATASPRQVTVAAAIAAASAVGTGGKEPTVQVEAAVTAPSGLLNDAGTQIVVADATGAILAVLPTGTPHRAVGTVLRLTGTAGRSLGAPRLLVRAVEPIDSAAAPPPVDLRRPPAAVDEWHLVRVSGRLVELHTLGDRWRAEMLVGGTRVPIVGLAGSGIAAPRSPVGRLAVVTGIVRRPNPQATDRRYELVPRAVADLELGPVVPSGQAVASSAPGSAGRATDVAAAGTPAIDLRDLALHAGSIVRVGGLVTSVDATIVTLDDGTAQGRLVLEGPAAPYAELIEAGDAVEATGRIESAADGCLIRVQDPAALVRAGDLDAAGSGAAAAATSNSVGGPGASTAVGSTGGSEGLRPGGQSAGLPGAAFALALAIAGSGAVVGALFLRRRRVQTARRIQERLVAITVPKVGPR